MAQYRYFGEKIWPLPDGTFFFLTACLDLVTRPDIEPILDEVAAEFLKAENERTAEFGDRIILSVVALGYEHGKAPLQELHGSYNRIWEQHPRLWERVLERGFPTSFWLVDRQRSPFYALIQPAQGFAFELWSAPDIRETDLYRRYLHSDDFRWQAPLVPVLPSELDGMCAFVESHRA